MHPTRRRTLAALTGLALTIGLSWFYIRILLKEEED